MPAQTSTIISKVWGMCNPLRDNRGPGGRFFFLDDFLKKVMEFCKIGRNHPSCKTKRKRECQAALPLAFCMG